MSLNEELRRRALSLPARERAELAHDLLVSLEQEVDPPGIDQDLAEEVLRRSDEYHAGRAKAIDWEESLARVRASFARSRCEKPLPSD
jgi:putative addiction module component (TIGR02574 family)